MTGQRVDIAIAHALKGGEATRGSMGGNVMGLMENYLPPRGPQPAQPSFCSSAGRGQPSEINGFKGVPIPL